MATTPKTSGPSVVLPGEGVTAAERRLANLCKRSFLSLWSYPAVFRDQGRADARGDGKEVCDLLVVFENHIIVFSDKDCEFRDTGNLERDWSRWYKRAVLKSAEQVYGAERWIRKFPNRLFIDRKCCVPFPIALPDPGHVIFHRVVVAHNGARRCREVMGGSGSLMLDNSLVGDAHLVHPFTVGQINSAKGYVHVFDDTTLDVVMRTLDTISDFTAYLTKKERFLADRVVMAAGEEELLAVYLAKLNRNGEHDFIVDGNYDFLGFAEGFWEKFVNSPERRSQLEGDEISYAWDALIEKSVYHAMTGTEYFPRDRPLSEQEIIYRFMAREPRTRRRLLARHLHEVLQRSLTSQSAWDVRVMMPSRKGDPHYVFLFLKYLPDMTDEEYRKIRGDLLANYCYVVRLKYPDATHIVGIATESGKTDMRSEDLLYWDVSDWNAEAEAHAREIQERLGLLKRTKLSMGREHEYPVDHTGAVRSTVWSRNSTCRCGSGKRFKRCCGKALF
jgi:hypothetical protein